ncbi:MAG: acyl-CoA thioesterase II [Sphingomonadales bacterium]|nr:MAG: acyl-CoA thioesterase II [Sphingomonadales bacterium]
MSNDAPDGPAAPLLAGLFDYEERGRNRFRAAPTLSAMQRLYGGQAIAQALDAARRTVPEDRACHSCHAYFVRPGDPKQPIDLAVSRDTDSRSFSARRITARQGGQLILSMAASFQMPAAGPAHQSPMPEVPPPEGLPTQRELVDKVGTGLPEWTHAFWLSEQAIEYRFCEPFHIFRHEPEPPQRHVWMRVRMRLPDAAYVHQRLLAYASDLHIMHGGLLPLGVGWADTELRTASLDHVIWFHDRFRADEWLLYDLDSDFTGHARTLGRGRVFTRDGRLVASVMQEGLARIVA